MEISGMVSHQKRSFFDTHCRKTGVSIHPREWVSGEVKMRAPSTDVKVSGFSDNGHLKYYVEAKCGEKKMKKEKEKVKVIKKDREEMLVKKKLKAVKGLVKSLSKYSDMGIAFGSGDENDQKMNLGPTQILVAQLEQLKSEKEILKRKKKEEKVKLNAALFRSMNDNEDSSSSSSSESSDNECEVVNMKQMRNMAIGETRVNVQPTTVAEVFVTSTIECNRRDPSLAEAEVDYKLNLEIQALLNNLNPLSGEVIEDHSLPSSAQECCSGSSNGDGVQVSAIEGRIDVCMGGKCKKMGALALKDELQKRIGVEGAVTGCKCMGKCKSAPNVRVLTDLVNGADTSIRIPSNPLYIGVGLEDVDAIVSYYLAEGSKNACLNLALLN